jgi:hypothetical protein
MCTEIGIRVQILHLAGELSGAHTESGGWRPSRQRSFPYGPMRAYNKGIKDLNILVVKDRG